MRCTVLEIIPKQKLKLASVVLASSRNSSLAGLGCNHSTADMLVISRNTYPRRVKLLMGYCIRRMIICRWKTHFPTNWEKQENGFIPPKWYKCETSLKDSKRNHQGQGRQKTSLRSMCYENNTKMAISLSWGSQKLLTSPGIWIGDTRSSKYSIYIQVQGINTQLWDIQTQGKLGNLTIASAQIDFKVQWQEVFRLWYVKAILKDVQENTNCNKIFLILLKVGFTLWLFVRS